LAVGAGMATLTARVEPAGVSGDRSGSGDAATIQSLLVCWTL
jgi:hypothetical protein